MRVDHHLILVLPKILDEVGRSQVVFETRHHKFLRKVARRDLLGERRVEDVQHVGFRLLME